MVRQKILHIEKLRGLSILLVLLFHAQVPGFQNGYLGVDIFFVISGYLMASIYGDIAGAVEIKNYLFRRCARILPAYYAVIAVTLIVAVGVLLPHEIDMVMGHSRWAAFLLPNFGFWLDAAYFDYTLFRPLLNLWSLGVEVQFYLLFPLLLIIQRRSPKLLLLLVVLSFLEYVLLSFVDTRSAFFLIPGRIWQFMLGYYAVTFAAKNNATVKHLGAFALVLLLLFLSLAPSFEFEYSLVATCVVMALTFVAISFGFSTGSENNFLSSTLRLLGKYSYSIYLVHFPIMVFINYVPFGGTNLVAAGPFSLLLILLCTAVLSYLLFNTVEATTRNRISTVQLSALAASCCLAVLLIANNASSYNLAGYAAPPVKISKALSDRGSYQCKGMWNTLFSGTVNMVSAISTVSTESCQVSSGTEGSTRFLLFGDSHADSIKQPLAELLQTNSQTLRYLKGYRAINQQNDGELVIAEAVHNDIDVIILHALAQTDQGAALDAFLLSAQSHNLAVAFIAPVPVYQFDVPKKLFANYQAGTSLNRWGKPLQNYRQANQQLLDKLDLLKARFSNFSWFSAADYLCEQHCYISAADWTPYYFDSNHLTLTGAAQLQPVFESISKLR